MADKKIKALHPGKILKSEFLEPLKVSPEHLAVCLKIPFEIVRDIVSGSGAINPELALRLGRFFQTSSRFWLGLQLDYELDVAEDRLAERVAKEIAPHQGVDFWRPN